MPHVDHDDDDVTDSDSDSDLELSSSSSSFGSFKIKKSSLFITLFLFVVFADWGNLDCASMTSYEWDSDVSDFSDDLLDDEAECLL